MSNLKIKKVIVSVSDKNNLEILLSYFEKMDIEVYSTGGTFEYIQNKNLKVKLYEISKISNFPEILNGKVKTLQPFIHAGILCDKKNKSHLEQLKKLNLPIFDMVVVNLYPFSKAIKNYDTKFDDCIKQIDIGGPAMIRAAAKNFPNIVVLSDPCQYKNFVDLATHNEKKINLEFRKSLAQEAFNKTAYYDAIINQWLNKDNKNFLQKKITIPLTQVKKLRYGENPHQIGSLYKFSDNPINQISGKEISYNNIFDLEIAIKLAYELDNQSCVILKHGNPCGVSTSSSQTKSYLAAFSADPISAFGGIIAFNSQLTLETAKKLKNQFAELVIAPKISRDAKLLLCQKKNLILIEYKKKINNIPKINLRTTNNFILAQDQNNYKIKKSDLDNKTNHKPSINEYNDMIFAYKVCKYVNSNAIVIVKNLKTIGIGVGQTNRVDSAKQAIKKMKYRNKKVVNAILASDGFFPFPDIVELCAKNSISVIIQPGGSINDPKIIAACQKNKISLVFTGKRQFKH